MAQRVLWLVPLLAALVLVVPHAGRAAVRRHARSRGLLEMYRQKPPLPRSLTYETYWIPGNRTVGEVAMDGRTLFHVVAPAGGFTVEQRAEYICRRLERLIEEKAALEPVRVEDWDGEWVVTLGGSLVITAATGVSRRYHMSRRELANRWADNLRTALYNALGPGGQVLRGDPPVEKIRVTMPPWDDRYRCIIKGDRAYGRGSYAEASTWYERALREDPSGYDARFCLGRAYAHLGRLDSARDEFVACLQLRPNYQRARLALAIVDRMKRRRANEEGDVRGQEE